MTLMEKVMAPHSSTLAWKTPWTEEPCGLQSMGSLGVGHDWATSLSLFNFSLSCIGEGNGNPLQWSCLENPRDGGAWWAAIYGVAQSRTRLKRLSSSSNSIEWEKLEISSRKLEIRRNISCKHENNKGRKQYGPTEAVDIKKRWQEYTEELYKKLSSSPR